MVDLDLLDPGLFQSEQQRLLDVGGGHGRAQAPGEDVARKVVQHGAQIVPAPAHHLELREVRLPQLIDPLGRMLKSVTRLDQLKGRAGDQVVALENAVNAGVGDEVAFGVGDMPGQLARRLVRSLESELNHLLAYRIGNTVPEPAWPRRLVRQSGGSCYPIPSVPAVERPAWHP